MPSRRGRYVQTVNWKRFFQWNREKKERVNRFYAVTLFSGDMTVGASNTFFHKHKMSTSKSDL